MADAEDLRSFERKLMRVRLSPWAPVFSMRTFLALALAKSVNFALRKAKVSGGTALPGLLALKIAPDFIHHLTQNFSRGNILVSGTNGKTTTTRMLATILDGWGIAYLHNRAGSNLLRGIASTLAEKLPSFKKWDLGLWEVDEATVLPAVSQIKPKILVLLNLFRDQLDRYGEIDKIKKLWIRAVKKLPKTSILVLNADDPAVAHLGHNFPGKVIYFGIQDKKSSQKTLPRFADTRYCPSCATSLSYQAVYASHLGEYQCSVCGYSRPSPDFSAASVQCLSPVELEFTARSKVGEAELKLNLGGLYNVYNSLSAIATSSALGIDFNKTISSLNKFKPAFGRTEEITIGKSKIRIFLIKNPTGANEVLRTVLISSKKKNLLLALNDKIADGTDVSWIWDVDFARLLEKVKHLIITGTRADDLALRLKYAGIKKPDLVTEDFSKAIKNALKRKENFYFLPTYTAMLEVKNELNRLGLSQEFWRD